MGGKKANRRACGISIFHHNIYFTQHRGGAACLRNFNTELGGFLMIRGREHMAKSSGFCLGYMLKDGEETRKEFLDSCIEELARKNADITAVSDVGGVPCVFYQYNTKIMG